MKNFDESIEALKAGIVYNESEIAEHIANIRNKYPDVAIRRVCGYGRVSTKYEEQETSLQTQHEIFRRYCDSHESSGYVLVQEIYEQKTGTLKEKRKKFMQMVDDAKAGKYDVLLFKDSKRFSRNAEDYLNLVEDLKRQGISVVFINEGFNSELEKDRSMLTMLGMMAESYSNSLHINLTAALRVRMESEQGRLPGNVFGYKRHENDTSKADIIPEQAELLRELFKRYSEGEGIASICKDWISRGIKTYRGGQMSMFALRRFIRNPLYKGILVMGRYTKADVRAKRVRMSDEDVIIRERQDLIIIDPDLWDECNRIMDTRKKIVAEHIKREDVIKNKLFSGVIKCGECGRNYNRKPSNHKDKKKRYEYLMCGYKKYNKLNQANFEACHNEKVLRLDTLLEVLGLYINDLVLKEYDFKEFISEKIMSIFKEMQANDNIGCTNDELEEAQKKFKRYLELYKEGLIEKEEFYSMRADLKKKEDSIKAKKSVGITKAEIDSLASQFIDNLKDIMQGELVDQGGVDVIEFNKLFDTIVVYPDHVDIIFKVLKDKRFREIEKMDIKEIVPEEHRDLKFLAPIVDNDIAYFCKTDFQPFYKNACR